MPLRLITTKELNWFYIYFHKETQDPWLVDDENNPIDPDENMEKSGFGLALLSSGDMSTISNKLYSTSRKGKSQFEYGTASKSKTLVACKKVTNVGDVEDPEQEIDFTSKMFDTLPPWVSERLLDEINTVNNLTEDEEQD